MSAETLGLKKLIVDEIVTEEHQMRELNSFNKEIQVSQCFN